MIASCSPRLTASFGFMNAFDPITLKSILAKPHKPHIFQIKTHSICSNLKLLGVYRSLSACQSSSDIWLPKRYSCDRASSKFFPASMTNKPRITLQQSTNQSNACLKSHLTTSVAPVASSGSDPKSYHLAQSPNFRTMAGIQKLVTEPTREHIENIRLFLRRMNAKNNDNQQISLDRNHETGIAIVCIRSAAKNGISGRMMCDMLDIIDELYSWNEGKGVIIYGHKGFFCSGKKHSKDRDANHKGNLNFKYSNQTAFISIPLKHFRGRSSIYSGVG